MADILEGTSDLSTTAPLSQSQTVALVRHVQQEIRDVESAHDETSRDLHRATEHLQKLKDQQLSTHDDVHNLQVGLNDTNLNLGKLENQVGRILEAVGRLQGGYDNASDKILQLEEGRRMTETRLDVISADMAQEKMTSQLLKQLLETKVKDDMRLLSKNMENFGLAMEHVKMEQGLMSEAQKQDRDSLRQAHLNIEMVLGEVKKANTVTNIIENRLSQTARGVQHNFAKLDEAMQIVMTLKEGQAMMKDRVGDAENFIKQVSDAGQHTNEKLEDTLRFLERTSDKLGQVQKMVEEGGMATEEMKLQMNSLKQALDTTSRRLDAYYAELKEVGQIASANRAGIKEQSSILLPNIHMDSNEAVTASARHGSLLMTGPISTGRPPSKNSPRIPKKQNKSPATTWT